MSLFNQSQAFFFFEVCFLILSSVTRNMTQSITLNFAWLFLYDLNLYSEQLLKRSIINNNQMIIVAQNIQQLILFVSLFHSIDYKFCIARKRISSMEKKGSATDLYNLFSTGKTSKEPKPIERPKTSKAQFQIVFHHPNFLYLSQKKQKTRAEESRQIEARIKSQLLRKTHTFQDLKSENIRPYTSDASSQNNNLKQRAVQKRCFTSSTAKRNRTTDSWSNNQERLQVLGNSSSGFGQLFANKENILEKPMSNKPQDLKTQQESKRRGQGVFQFLEATQPKAKLKTWQKLLRGNQYNVAVRHNMCLDIEKKFIKYNTHKPKGPLKRKSLMDPSMTT